MRRLLRAESLAGEQLQRWESLQWHCRALEEAANDLGAGAYHDLLPSGNSLGFWAHARVIIDGVLLCYSCQCPPACIHWHRMRSMSHRLTKEQGIALQHLACLHCPTVRQAGGEMRDA